MWGMWLVPLEQSWIIEVQRMVMARIVSGETAAGISRLDFFIICTFPNIENEILRWCFDQVLFPFERFRNNIGFF